MLQALNQSDTSDTEKKQTIGSLSSDSNINTDDKIKILEGLNN